MTTVLGFTLTYTFMLLAYGHWVESDLTLVYTGINLGLVLVFALLHRWACWPTYALWVMSLVGLGNMFGGVFLVQGEALYMTDVVGNIGYDKVFHAVAAGAMAPVTWEALKRWSGGVYHLAGQLILSWLVVMGGGAVVEIAELIGSAASDVNVGDYANNALDLVANGLGAATGTFGVWIRERAKLPVAA